MGSTRAAIRYAKAILNLTKDSGSTDAVLNDMKDVVATLGGSKDLRLALQNPVIKVEDKRAVLKEVFKGTSKETLGLIDILVDNKRVDLLGHVATSFVTLYNESQGVQLALVTTAVPLTAAIEKKVLAKVTELTGSTNVKLENIIDESIIGGFVLRVGDTQYNASIASQLGKLKREFSNSL
ncbi:ATP synthase subunit delta [Dokdonia pacifica]|uniref:ATP synthase subunit delta n=1 Tax=Dokdonia pacifica TaxID=1627892 RepID=A0A238WHL7_9FLAO|nr:ATP synthase F1 subunit delta [Dokdonia pacifica]GGG21196.1 ATP synthase subunit delta [Dokdonia pacifica]SNR45967.1 ATP synthase F1 subcomplex delta subunit [Dokdonia pacifica]